MGKGFDFNDFITETIAIITSPATYFSSIKEEKELFASLIKVIFYVALAQLVGIIPISLVTKSSNLGVYLMLSGGILAAAIPIFFITALLLLIISAICGGNTNFKSNAWVVASVMIVYPLSVIMSIFYNVNVYFQAILTALVALYSLWLLYLGLVKTLGAKSIPSLAIVTAIAIFPIYSAGKTVYYKAQGLKLPYEQERERIEDRRRKLEQDLKQKGVLPENYQYAPEKQ